MIEHKIIFTGTMGAGKTTAIGKISEIAPISTDVQNTDASVSKATTTVGLDYGELTLDNGDKLRLYGTPGQERFGFMWDDLAVGAIGGIALVDTRRIDDSFVAIDWFEARKVPFIVAVNSFAGSVEFSLDEIREALGVPDAIPVMACDARSKEDVKAVLLGLVDHLVRNTAPAV